MKYLLIIINIIFLFLFKILAQNPEWINYTNGDVINAIEIEGDFMWVGTRGGLVKINRVSGHKTFFNKANSGLLSNWIKCIAIDESNNKWIGTEEALLKFDGINWTVYNASNSQLPGNSVWSIVIDDSGNKWIGTRGGGLAKFDGINWKIYNIWNSGLPALNITSIAVDKLNNKWIGTWGGGLAKFDDTNWEVFNSSNSILPHNWINSITIDSSGNKWIGFMNSAYGNGGIVKFDNFNWTFYDSLNSALPTNEITCIYVDHLENKWIGVHKGGLVKFDDSNWTVYNSSNSGLTENSVWRIAIDDSNIKWIATDTKGLVKFDNFDWITIPTSNSGLPSNWIYNITIDQSNNKWIGSHTFTGFGRHHGDGLTKYNDKQWEVYDIFNSGIPSNSVIEVAVDSAGNKWIATQNLFNSKWNKQGGLARFDGERWTVYDTSNSGIPANEISCITIDLSNNKWIGTMETGFAEFNDSIWNIYNTSNSGLPSNNILCIEIDDSNFKWIGTDSGLVKYDGSNWDIYNSTHINNIEIDDVGQIWIGTNGGLLKYDGVIWTLFNTSNSGIPSNEVNYIAICDNSIKWIGTWGGGLTKFDDIFWTIYNESNSGLPKDDISCISIDIYGNKWIGTRFGLAVFNEGGIVSVENHGVDRSVFKENYNLSQNYPNPFNSQTNIRYVLPKTDRVKLEIYNVLGQRIRTFLWQNQRAGAHQVVWDGRDEKGIDVSSGVYFYRLITVQFSQTRKMLILR